MHLPLVLKIHEEELYSLHIDIAWENLQKKILNKFPNQRPSNISMGNVLHPEYLHIRTIKIKLTSRCHYSDKLPYSGRVKGMIEFSKSGCECLLHQLLTA